MTSRVPDEPPAVPVGTARQSLARAADIGRNARARGREVVAELRRGACGSASRTLGRLSVETAAMALHAVGCLIDASSRLSTVRALYPEERAVLERVFGTSPALDAIRLHRGGIAHRLGMRAHAVGDDLRFPEAAFTARGRVRDAGLLVHEATHAWQFRHGGAGYLSAALLSYARPGDPYDWRAALGRELPFAAMTPDQQAELARLVAIALLVAPDAEPTRDSLAQAIPFMGGDGCEIDATMLRRIAAVRRCLLDGDAAHAPREPDST